MRIPKVRDADSKVSSVFNRVLLRKGGTLEHKRKICEETY